MSVRVTLVTAAALIGFSVLSAPAFAAQTIQIPDPRITNPNAAPPDALFDNSISDSWEKKSDSSDNQNNKLGGFHFSVRGSNDQFQPATNPNSASYHDPLVPGSEFYQPLPGYNPDPYAPR
jgi:hypothetical protein